MMRNFVVRMHGVCVYEVYSGICEVCMQICVVKKYADVCMVQASLCVCVCEVYAGVCRVLGAL